MNTRLLGRTALALSAALFFLSALPPLFAAPPRRAITEKDLLKFNWIADPRLSPDGSQVVFVRVNVDEKKDTYTTSLWAVSTGNGALRQLSNGPRDTAPRWSPDGRSLVFLRSLDKDSKPAPPQLYFLSLEGGEARALSDLPKGVSEPAWSPDGRHIAFVSSTTAKDLEKKKAQKEDQDDKESDVRVVKEALYRIKGAGYIDFDRPDHLWTVELSDQSSLPVPKQLTAGDFAENNPAWSPDGRSIYFSSDRTYESYYQPPNQDVYAVSAAGGPIQRVADIDGPIGDFAISPDGRRIAFVGFLNARPTRSYNQPDLFVASLEANATARNLTADYDYDIGDGLTADQHPPRGGGATDPIWSGDGREIVLVSVERGRANLKRFDVATGKISELTTGNQEVLSYSATPDGSKIALTLSTPASIGDLFWITNGSKPKPLTRLNQELFSQLDLGEPEEITYTSFDGKPIQAWVQKPPGFDPSKKYPLILNIHGGPHAAYGTTFFHEMQWMAARGYVVLYPNPRGSTSYGQDFGNIIQYHYPGDDAKDLLAGVDLLIARGYIDPDRLGVTGGSGGGILTNWIVGHTDRFKAAVSQRSISDWRDFWYTADFTLFTPFWFRGAPWQEEADFKARSPISFVENIKTPLMLIEGESDLRTPPAAGGEQLFRALKYLKRPTVMVRFPGETHELSRSGKPSHRIERLQHIVGWFDRYLLDKPMPIYDPPGTAATRDIR